MRKWLLGLILFAVCADVAVAANITTKTESTSPSLSSKLYVAETPFSASDDRYTTLGNLLKSGKITMDGTNVGINNVSPEYPLDVTGTARATTLIGSLNTATSGSALAINGLTITGVSGNNGTLATTTGTLTSQNIVVADASGNLITSNVGIGSFAISGLTTNYLPVASNSTTIVNSSAYQDSNGNIGIGSTAPGVKLDVQGSVRATGFVGDGSGLSGISGSISGLATGKLTKATSATTIGDSVMSEFSNNIGIGSVNPIQKLDVTGTGHFSTGMLVSGSGSGKLSSGNGIQIDSANTSFTTPNVTFTTGGNTGIGTVTAPSRLTVAGTAEMTGFKLSTGPGAGNVLVSTSVGIGTWMSPASIGAGGGGGSTQWTTDGNNIYYNTGNVGVGSTTPDGLIVARGADAEVKVRATSGSLAAMSLYNPTGQQYSMVMEADGDAILYQATANDLEFWTNDTAQGYFTSAGNLILNNNMGIGSANPESYLQVRNDVSTGLVRMRIDSISGTPNFVAAGNTGSKTPAVTLQDNNGGATNTDKAAFVLGRDSSPPVSGMVRNDVALHTPSGSGKKIFVVTEAVGTQGIVIDSTGNVGIGTHTPGTAALSIPAIKASSGTRYVCIDTVGRITSSASPCSGT